MHYELYFSAKNQVLSLIKALDLASSLQEIWATEIHVKQRHCDDPAKSAKGENSTGQMTASSMNTQDGNGGWVREMLSSKRFKSLGIY